MVAAVEKGSIAPGRVAVALAQRFTEERIATSFPVLSLLDFLLAHLAKVPPGPAQPASVALAAVLAEFWKLAPGLFGAYATVAEAALRDKVLKRLRRWKQRNLLTEPTVGKLITVAEEGPDKKSGEGPATGEGGVGAEGGARPPPRGAFTHAQAHAFAAVLRRCTSLLEQLPAARSGPYFELIEQEHLTRPTAAAFVFFQDLLSELQARELNGGASPSSNAAGGQGRTGRSGEEGTGSDSGAATNSNRAALGQLLDKLSANSGEEAGRDGGGAASAAAAVIKYTSPLFSDVHLRQPLAQRMGFAALAKRRLPAVAGRAGGSGVGTGDMYYPKKEANTRRPFRVPAALAQDGPPVRTWFPTPQAWLAMEDTGDAPMFASKEDAKMGMDSGWQGGGGSGGGGGGRKRSRE